MTGSCSQGGGEARTWSCSAWMCCWWWLPCGTPFLQTQVMLMNLRWKRRSTALRHWHPWRRPWLGTEARSGVAARFRSRPGAIREREVRHSLGAGVRSGAAAQFKSWGATEGGSAIQQQLGHGPGGGGAVRSWDAVEGGGAIRELGCGRGWRHRPGVRARSEQATCYQFGYITTAAWIFLRSRNSWLSMTAKENCILGSFNIFLAYLQI